jgi:hypothetical protein
MQIVVNRSQSGFTLTYYEGTHLLATMRVTLSQTEAEGSVLSLVSCEVTQALNEKPILQGKLLYANGVLVEAKNTHIVANWAFKLILHWMQIRT